MIITYQQLLEKYGDYANPKGKIARLVQRGEIFQIKRGLYETEPKVSGDKLSQYIYGPSYLSFDYMLYEYGLIPEAVYSVFTSATFRKNRRRTFANRYGMFTYQDVPAKVFHMGVTGSIADGYAVLKATPEKAVCDKLYSLPPMKSVKSVRECLFDDLRLDEEAFWNLNKGDLIELIPKYGSTTLENFGKLLDMDGFDEERNRTDVGRV